MNPDELRVIVSRLTAIGYQTRKAVSKEGFILLAKEEPFRQKLLLIGTSLHQAEEWRSLIIQTVLAERNERTPLALAVLVVAVGELAAEKKILDYLGEMPWVEAIWERVGDQLATVRSHFRWQVEEKVLHLTARLATAVAPGEVSAPRAGREKAGVRPKITYLLLVINLVVFALEILAGGSNQTSVLVRMGAKYSPRLWLGEFWRLLTPLFLHAGWEHFLFNSLALFQLGGLVEHFFGQARFFWIYFGAGLSGTVASVLFRPDTISVGASGAIFGLLGALVYFSLRRPQVAKGLFGRSLWVTLGFNLVLGFVIPGIDYMGHIGGLFGGLLWAYALGLGNKDHISGRWLWRVLLVVVTVFATAKALTPPPTKWHLPFEVGRIAVEEGDFEKALGPLEESYRLNPKSPLTKRTLAGVYVSKGGQALVDEAWDEAVHYLEQSHRLQPGSREARALLVQAYLYRGFHRYNIGDLVGSKEDCLRGIALNAKVEGFHYILGVVYYQENQWAEAMKELETVVQLNPENEAAHALLAELKKEANSLK